MREPIKKRTVGPKSTGLGQGYGEAEVMGGGIVPGAHPEMERGPRLGNPMKQMKSIWDKLFPKGQGRH